jgi:hypothetical protein
VVLYSEIDFISDISDPLLDALVKLPPLFSERCAGAWRRRLAAANMAVETLTRI